jgi:hypothetical protein
MAYTFEIRGEVATDIETAHGSIGLYLETGNDIEQFWFPAASPLGREVAMLSAGDRVALEVERDGHQRTVLGIRVTYARGFPRIG